MAKICDISGKKTAFGNRVQHQTKKVTGRHARRFYVNLQHKRFYIPELEQWVPVKVATSVLRDIDKHGLLPVLRKARQQGTLNRELWFIADHIQ